MIRQKLAGSVLLLVKDGIQNGNMLLIADLISKGFPCCNTNEVQVVYQTAHELGSILIMKGIHQVQMEFVIQRNEGRGSLTGLACLIILVFQQQISHISGPLKVHLIKTLPKDHRFQQQTDLKNVVDALGSRAGNLDPFAGMNLHKVVLSQRQDGFAYWCSAESQKFLELRLVYKLAGSKIFLQNHGFDLIVCLLGQTGLPFGIDRCHRQLPPATIYHAAELIYHMHIHVIYHLLQYTSLEMLRQEGGHRGSGRDKLYDYGKKRG